MEHRPGVDTTGKSGSMGWRTFSLFQLKGQSHQFYEEFKGLGLGGMTLGFDMEGAIDG